MARITVVNDSEEFLDLMRDVVTGLGHDMVGPRAVHSSIEQIVASNPDLLIVDLRLQDSPQEVSGWELVILARSHRMLTDVPLILCTGELWEIKKRAEDLERIAGVHVRTKPFELEEMNSLIARLLEGTGETAA